MKPETSPQTITNGYGLHLTYTEELANHSRATFRLKAGEQAPYSDIHVNLDGKTKDMTYDEFKKRLMDEV